MLLAIVAAMITSANAYVPGDLPQPKPTRPGLPGLTPAKKASSGSSVPFAEHRFALLDNYCPTATPEELSGSYVCDYFAITKKMRTATAEEKKALSAQRSKLFADLAKRTDEQKKTAVKKNLAIYKNMYAKYCTSDRLSTPACTNETFKKIYGSAKPATEL